MTEAAGVAKEIERKFLLTSLPTKLEHGEVFPAKGTAEDLAKATYYTIDHGWIPGEVIQERITYNTRGSGEYWRTIKTGKGIERIEAQEPISQALFEKMWALTEGKRVQKVRYCVPEAGPVWTGIKWEVDKFLDRTLFLAEVEIPRADYPLEIPLWLASFIVKEVTDNPNYLNIKLAK